MKKLNTTEAELKKKMLLIKKACIYNIFPYVLYNIK